MYAIMTVWKTHSWKTTFAKKLQEELAVHPIDRDEILVFLKENYKSLYESQKDHQSILNLKRSKESPRIQDSIRDSIVEYSALVKENICLCNWNANKDYRANELAFLKDLWYQTIIIHFDLDNTELQKRIKNTNRSTSCLTWRKNFYEVLEFQGLNFDKPEKNEADYFFVVNDSNYEVVIEWIKSLLDKNNIES